MIWMALGMVVVAAGGYLFVVGKWSLGILLIALGSTPLLLLALGKISLGG